MPETIVFDVNETLLDLSALEPLFENHFGNAAVRRECFAEMLKQAFITTITGAYRDFSVLQRSALLSMEARHGKELKEAQRQEFLDGMQQLPAYPDVLPGLARLGGAGCRIVALTNSPLEIAEAQLGHAGLRTEFDRVFSADTVRRLKPAWEPYAMAVRELGVDAKGLLLVAAHSWDVAGAAVSGWRTAFVSRPGQRLDSLTPHPAYIANDLVDLATKLVGA